MICKYKGCDKVLTGRRLRCEEHAMLVKKEGLRRLNLIRAGKAEDDSPKDFERNLARYEKMITDYLRTNRHEHVKS